MSRPALSPIPVTSWRVQELGGLDLLHGSFTTHSFSRHAHETYSIGLLSRGGMTFQCGGATYTQRPGLIGLINPDEAHNGQANDAQGWTYRNFYPSVALMMAAFTEPGASVTPPKFPLVIDDAPLLTALIRAHAAFEASTSSLLRESLMQTALTHLVSRHGRQVPVLPGVRREAAALELVRQKLEDDLTHNVSLQDLAQLSGLNSFSLLRAFRQVFGLPPHAYQIQVRLRQAKRLLQSGLTPAEVALNVGFADQSHFGRHFRRTFGLTPDQYKRGLPRIG